MIQLVIKNDSWSRIRKWMLCDGNEHLAFILVEFERTGKNIFLLEKEVIIVEDDELQNNGEYGLELKLPSLIKIMNLATRTNSILVEIHSHPFSYHGVDFSSMDNSGQKNMMTYLKEAVAAKVYAALVAGSESVKGHLLFSNQQKPQTIDRIRIVGPNSVFLCADGKNFNNSELNENETYQRQALALGAQGNKSIQSVKAGVVGLGGIGSIVSQQLAHLGVSEITYIDDDILEKSNLHRVVGASVADVGKAKVDIASRNAKKINSQIKTKPILGNVRAKECLEALKNCDVIFGCMDTDSGRLILAELANAYLIPYIDAAVGIIVENGHIAEAGGRIHVWTPDKACLNCANEIDMRVAAEELESAQEMAFRKRHGYVVGAHVPEPAVISLNGTVASMAVTEYLCMFSGIRPCRNYTHYDFMEQKAFQRNVNQKEGCVICGSQAKGAKTNLERYARVGLPTDIPLPLH